METRSVPIPKPGEGQVLVQMICSGCCHTDLHIFKEGWVPEVILGHEGIGLVCRHGPGVDEESLPMGTRVGINWLHKTCGTCTDCLEGAENVCRNQKNSGLSTNGTLAEYCIAEAAFAVRIPEGIASTDAAPVMCAGVCVYKALKDSGVRPGQSVVINGAAGGLGHFGVQLAAAMGMQVIGIDTGTAKMDLLRSLAVQHALDYKAIEDMPTKILELTRGRGADGVIQCAGASSVYAETLKYLKRRGSMVCLALPMGTFELQHLLLVGGACKVCGSCGGTRADMREVWGFVLSGQVRGLVEVREGLEEVAKTFEDLEKGAFAGRVVVSINPGLESERPSKM